MTRLLIFALGLIAFYAPVPAMAQDEDLPEVQTYDPTFSGVPNEAADYIRSLQRQSMADKGFIKPQVVQVALVHYPYMTDDQFGIQMSVPDMISGCYKLTPLEYEANFVDPYFLDIKVKKYRRIAPEGIPGHTKCEKQNKMSTALMVLDKKDLMKRGTQEIRFSTEVATDKYKIIMDDAHLELKPESMVVFKGQNLAGPLKDRLIHSFASDKMVALHVPMAQPGEDITQAVVDFARHRALVPTDIQHPAAWGGNGLATYYFYDDNGHIIDQIGEDGYAELGKIEVDRPYDGPEGRTVAPVGLSVFVTRPGTQL